MRASSLRFAFVALVALGAHTGCSGCDGSSGSGATLLRIQVDPQQASAAAGTTLRFTATGIYSDMSKQDVTTVVAWRSSNGSVATVDNAVGKAGTATAVAPGTVTLTASSPDATPVIGSAALTVTPATVTALAIAPSNPTIARGTTQAFHATAQLSDGTMQDVTAQASWAVSDDTVASVSNDAGSAGVASGLSAGTTMVTASFSGQTAGTKLTVTGAMITEVDVAPTAASIAKGTSLPLTATALFSDGSHQDVTASATWQSADATVATVRAVGGAEAAVGAGVGRTTLSATWLGRTGTTTITVTAAILTSIAVEPQAPTIAKGTTQAFTAIALFSDGTQQDVTASATWMSADEAVATVATGGASVGTVTAIAVGSTQISASFGGQTGASTLTVTDAAIVRIDVAPPNPTIALGTQQAFTATAVMSDNTIQDVTGSATWTSDNQAIATVASGAGGGIATSVGTGESRITASYGGVSGTTTLTVVGIAAVAIDVEPQGPTIAAGTTQAFTAKALFTDGSWQDVTLSATWQSSDAAVATVTNGGASAGLARGLASGSTTISAIFDNQTGTSTLTVSAATVTRVDVTPFSPSIALGTTQAFTATALLSDGTRQDVTASATWQSADSTIATVATGGANAGVARGVGLGSVAIRASYGGQGGSATLTVTAATLSAIQLAPTNPSIAQGTTQAFTATALFSDGTTQDVTASATWLSANTGVATVTSGGANAGTASAVAVGTTTISASALGQTGTTQLTVTAAVVTAIDVEPQGPSIARGATLQLTAFALMSDGSKQDVTAMAAWRSGDTGIATVATSGASAGTATGVAAGTTTIAASFGGQTGTTSLTVTGAVLVSVAVDPPAVSLAKGTTQQLTATGLYSDGSTQDVTTLATWVSSDGTAVTVGNGATAGLATAAAVGSANVTAIYGGFSDFAAITVTAATLSTLAVTPANATLIKGLTLQYVATATFSDGTTQDVTDTATWSSSSAAVATISNATTSVGIATGVAPGTTTISASFGGLTGSTGLTVDLATLQSIAVTPQGPQLAKGTQIGLTATGTYSDGSQQDITTSVSWTSSAAAVATVSNTAGSEGVVTAVAPGTAAITATLSGVSGSSLVTVTSAVVTSLVITPPSPTVTCCVQLQLAAIAHFSDGTQQDVTLQASWASSNKMVARVSNRRRTRGLVTTLAAGTSTLSATALGLTATTTLTVQ